MDSRSPLKQLNSLTDKNDSSDVIKATMSDSTNVSNKENPNSLDLPPALDFSSNVISKKPRTSILKAFDPLTDASPVPNKTQPQLSKKQQLVLYESDSDCKSDGPSPGNLSDVSDDNEAFVDASNDSTTVDTPVKQNLSNQVLIVFDTPDKVSIAETRIQEKPHNGNSVIPNLLDFSLNTYTDCNVTFDELTNQLEALTVESEENIKNTSDTEEFQSFTENLDSTLTETKNNTTEEVNFISELESETKEILLRKSDEVVNQSASKEEQDTLDTGAIDINEQETVVKVIEESVPIVIQPDSSQNLTNTQETDLPPNKESILNSLEALDNSPLISENLEETSNTKVPVEIATDLDKSIADVNTTQTLDDNIKIEHPPNTVNETESVLQSEAINNTLEKPTPEISTENKVFDELSETDTEQPKDSVLANSTPINDLSPDELNTTFEISTTEVLDKSRETTLDTEVAEVPDQTINKVESDLSLDVLNTTQTSSEISAENSSEDKLSRTSDTNSILAELSDATIHKTQPPDALNSTFEKPSAVISTEISELNSTEILDKTSDTLVTEHPKDSPVNPIPIDKIESDLPPDTLQTTFVKTDILNEPAIESPQISTDLNSTKVLDNSKETDTFQVADLNSNFNELSVKGLDSTHTISETTPDLNSTIVVDKPEETNKDLNATKTIEEPRKAEEPEFNSTLVEETVDAVNTTKLDVSAIPPNSDSQDISAEKLEVSPLNSTVVVLDEKSEEPKEIVEGNSEDIAKTPGEELKHECNLDDIENISIAKRKKITIPSKIQLSAERLKDMADLMEKKISEQQEISDLKLQLNAQQQARASLELEVRQKEEVIIKTQAESLKKEQEYRSEIKELNDKLKELSKLREKSSYKELEEQLKEAKDKAAQAINELMNKNKQEANEDYKKIMEEYENSLSAKNAEYQKLKDLHETSERHLANLELAFSDVHQKYERSKAIIEGYKANEESYRFNEISAEKLIRNLEERYESLKTHAKNQIDRSNKEIILQKKTFEEKDLQMSARIKRLEILCKSLEVSLEQKTNECVQLAALCDEVTGKNM